jgi:hypothetical protein
MGFHNDNAISCLSQTLSTVLQDMLIYCCKDAKYDTTKHVKSNYENPSKKSTE